MSGDRHSPFYGHGEVYVTPGRCVIWRCPNPPSDGKLACNDHHEGLILPPPPCKHGNTGRCKLCWESAQPEARNARNRAAYHRNKQDPVWLAKHRARKNAARAARAARQLASIKEPA